jgi:hypothetical protein
MVNLSQGTNAATNTTPIQSSNASQPAKTAAETQQTIAGVHHSSTQPPPKLKTPSPPKENTTSSTANIVPLTPSQPTPVVTKTKSSSTPVTKTANVFEGYYLKFAARKNKDNDSDDSRDNKDPPPLDIHKITKGEESSSSKEESSDEEGDTFAISRSLGIPLPIPAKKVASKRAIEDKKPAAKPRVSADTLYGKRPMLGKMTLNEDKTTAKINLIQEFN